MIKHNWKKVTAQPECKSTAAVS